MSETEGSLKSVVELLRENPSYVPILLRIVEVEETSSDPEVRNLGWRWFHVSTPAPKINSLVYTGLVRVVYNSRSSTNYRLANFDTAKEALRQVNIQEEQPEEIIEIPPNLFDVVLLHEGKKELIMRALQAERPVHALLIGDIASGKTVFLQELSRLPKSEYVLGSRLSSSGLYELMFEKRPRYLILDELDKVESHDNTSALLSLMETGILSEAKFKKRREAQFTTWVFAGANYDDRIPPALLSRFGAYKLIFRRYTSEEFLEVTTNVLIRREGSSPELSKYIAEQTLLKLGSKDVRDARSIARTAQTREDVDRILLLLSRERTNLA